MAKKLLFISRMRQKMLVIKFHRMEKMFDVAFFIQIILVYQIVEKNTKKFFDKHFFSIMKQYDKDFCQHRLYWQGI